MVTAENPYAGQGMVVLDIGGDIGALVVMAPAVLDGVEIEICPAGRRGEVPDDGGTWWQGEWRSGHGHDHPSGDDHGHEHGHGHGHEHGHEHASAWPHVAVLRRPGPGEAQYAAVFPGLRAGAYELWLRPEAPTALTAEVQPAQVSTVAWPN
jgi:hypothetical protein